jgi:hypothetical protein
MTDTSKLMPGEYYWVKIYASDEASPFKAVKWGNYIYFTNNKLKVLCSQVFAIDSNESGTPIPIKPPGAKERFVKMILNMAEADSESTESATEYLKNEGIDVDKLVKDGLSFIESVKEKIRNEKAGAKYFKTDDTY